MYLEMGAFIVAAAVISIIFFLLIQLIGDKLINSIYSKRKQIVENNKYYINDLQNFINENEISSDNINKLEDWVNDNKQIYITIKKSGEWIFFSDNVVQEQKEEYYEMSKWPGSANCTVELADGPSQVLIVGLYSYKAYAVLLICDIIASVVIFLSIFMMLLRKKVMYVEQLCNDIKILEGGNLDYRINVSGQDELAGLAVSLNDMRASFKEQIEEIEELTTANREIVTELSHDLRTPLTAVLLYAEILKADRFDSEEKRNECIEKIVGKMEHMKRLSERLLDYSISTSEEVIGGIDYYPAKEYLFQGLSDFNSYIENQGFNIDAQIEGRNVRVRLGEEYITRIFDNIASNIIKHADRKHEVVIKTEYTDENCLRLIFENTCIDEEVKNIESHGIGIKSIGNMMGKMGGEAKAARNGNIFRLILTFSYKE